MPSGRKTGLILTFSLKAKAIEVLDYAQTKTFVVAAVEEPGIANGIP